MKIKDFDCVEMKHKAAEKISERLQQMSSAERLSYWGKRFQQMKKKVKKSHQRSS